MLLFPEQPIPNIVDMDKLTGVALPFNLSIIIPVHNEEGFLSSSINGLIKMMEQLPVVYEIIICENGSKDRTKKIAESLSIANRNVKFLSIGEPNYGKALKQGILSARGEIIICDEIDICNTGFYSRALNLIADQGYDMVIGSKLHADAKDKRPFSRHLASIIINLFLRILLDFKGRDTHGLKAFKRKTILPIISQCIVDKDLFTSELVIRSERSSKRIKEIPVNIMEKRKPNIELFKRVPNVLRNLIKLFYAIRIKG